MREISVKLKNPYLIHTMFFDVLVHLNSLEDPKDADALDDYVAKACKLVSSVIQKATDKLAEYAKQGYCGVDEYLSQIRRTQLDRETLYGMHDLMGYFSSLSSSQKNYLYTNEAHPAAIMRVLEAVSMTPITLTAYESLSDKGMLNEKTNKTVGRVFLQNRASGRSSAEV